MFAIATNLNYLFNHELPCRNEYLYLHNCVQHRCIETRTGFEMKYSYWLSSSHWSILLVAGQQCCVALPACTALTHVSSHLSESMGPRAIFLLFLSERTLLLLDQPYSLQNLSWCLDFYLSSK